MISDNIKEARDFPIPRQHPAYRLDDRDPAKRQAAADQIRFGVLKHVGLR
ncbi:hypothetical protein HMSSN139_09910 [Paenibacillus sp. HMSSN-139]|nr:hypothetical protein HMSSN139_09910 [Paenibacillus sp. HMSSN-139]